MESQCWLRERPYRCEMGGVNRDSEISCVQRMIIHTGEEPGEEGVDL